MFHLFDVSSSGYYAYLKRSPSQRTLFNQQLDKKIEALFEEHRHLYGYRRLHVELLEEGYCLSRVCDITYVRVNQQWLYLAIVLDLYSRKIIGWAMSTHMKNSLVCQALTMAIFHRNYPSKVIVHSDRGSQYCSDAYQAILKAYDLKCSMSRKANCWDNPVAESFFHTHI